MLVVRKEGGMKGSRSPIKRPHRHLLSFLCSGFRPHSLQLCHSPLRRALNLLCIKIQIRGCLLSIVYFKMVVFFWQFTQSFSAILLEKQKQNTYTSQDGNKRKPQPVKDNFVPVSTKRTCAFWRNTYKSQLLICCIKLMKNWC